MTALRCVKLVSLAAVLASVAAALTLGAACTNGTTPTCDDAGSCLILQNPTDGTVSTNTDAPSAPDGAHDTGTGGPETGGTPGDAAGE